MKITKAMAAEIATKVVEKIEKKLEEARKELNEKVREMYMETIPADVLAISKKYEGKWVRWISTVVLDGNGFNRKYVEKITPQVPSVESYNKTLNITAAQSKILHKLDDKIQDLKEKKSRTYTEIEATLLALGTTKRVAEQLPELKPYLPAEGNTSLMIVPAKVRETVKCLVSDPEAKCIDKI